MKRQVVRKNYTLKGALAHLCHKSYHLDYDSYMGSTTIDVGKWGGRVYSGSVASWPGTFFNNDLTLEFANIKGELPTGFWKTLEKLEKDLRIYTGREDIILVVKATIIEKSGK